MVTKVQKWGNSQGLRFTKAIRRKPASTSATRWRLCRSRRPDNRRARRESPRPIQSDKKLVAKIPRIIVSRRSIGAGRWERKRGEWCVTFRTRETSSS